MRFEFSRAFLTTAVALSTVACASQAKSTPGLQRNVVTESELSVAGDVNLYEALSRLRPAFLRGRMPESGGVQMQPVTVFLDGVQMVEGVEYLRSVGARGVAEVRYLEPHQANARFGGNNTGGALVITTKK